MDYIVKDKFFSERVMDLEFQEPGDLSILYNGTHHVPSYGDLALKGWLTRFRLYLEVRLNPQNYPT